jgi:hypothetical protein
MDTDTFHSLFGRNDPPAFRHPDLIWDVDSDGNFVVLLNGEFPAKYTGHKYRKWHIYIYLSASLCPSGRRYFVT